MYNDAANKYSTIKIVVIAAIIAILLNAAAHEYDNKYTYPGKQAEFGILDLTDYDFDGNSVQYLVEGWEYYSGVLLAPKDFLKEDIIPDRYMYIGQYTSLESINGRYTPYGAGTYRLRLLTDGRSTMYKLEIPEIFSASNIYINGELLQKNGDVYEYRPKIMNTSIEFKADSIIEIVVNAKNADHYYGGMIYPPAFGTPNAVNSVIIKKVIIKSIQCFFALLMAAAYGSIYIFRRNYKQNMYFAMICFSFFIYNANMFYHGEGMAEVLNDFVRYRMEDIAFYSMIYFVLCLHAQFCKQKYLFFSKFMKALNIGIIIFVAAVPYVLTKQGELFLIYGLICDVFKLSAVVYILLSTSYKKSEGLSSALISGISILGISLAFDIVHIRYEPILLGWGAEIASFILVSNFAFVMIGKSVQIYRENLVLNSKMEQSYKYVQNTVHDIKAPLAAISGYMELMKSGVAKDMGKEDTYMRNMEIKLRELKDKVGVISPDKMLEADKLEITRISAKRLFRYIFEKYSDEAKAKAIKFCADCDDVEISVDIEKIVTAIDNLVVNSMRYTPANGSISVTLKINKCKILINVKDTGAGISKERLAKIFTRGYSGEMGRDGMGLSIVQECIKAHLGTVNVISKPNVETIFTIMIPQ